MSLPLPGDEDTCPVCRMPLLAGECLRHDTAEMIAWGVKYRRDAEKLAWLLQEVIKCNRGRLSRRKLTSPLEDRIDAALAEVD